MPGLPHGHPKEAADKRHESGVFPERVWKWEGMLTQMGERTSLPLECLTKNRFLEEDT